MLHHHQTCRALRTAAGAELVFEALAARRWPKHTLDRRRYGGSARRLVVDGNRANAEVYVDLTGLVSDYRFKRPTSWYQCRLLRLLWRRCGAGGAGAGGDANDSGGNNSSSSGGSSGSGGSSSSGGRGRGGGSGGRGDADSGEGLRLLIDARGEQDLRAPTACAGPGGRSSLAVLELYAEDGGGGGGGGGGEAAAAGLGADGDAAMEEAEAAAEEAAVAAGLAAAAAAAPPPPPPPLAGGPVAFADFIANLLGAAPAQAAGAGAQPLDGDEAMEDAPPAALPGGMLAAAVAAAANAAAAAAVAADAAGADVAAAAAAAAAAQWPGDALFFAPHHLAAPMPYQTTPQPALLARARAVQGAPAFAASGFRPTPGGANCGPGHYMGALTWRAADTERIVELLEGRWAPPPPAPARDYSGWRTPSPPPELRDVLGGGGDGVFEGGGGGGPNGPAFGAAAPAAPSSSASPPPQQQRQPGAPADAPAPAASASAAAAASSSKAPAAVASRLLVFCYANRLSEVGRVAGAAEWCDYTVVPLLEVPAGARVQDAMLAAPAPGGGSGGGGGGFDAIGAAERALAAESEAARRARWAGAPQEVLQREGWWR